MTQWHYKEGTLPVAEAEKPEPCTIEFRILVKQRGEPARPCGFPT
ncbi:hypothetical protein [Nostoc sp.]